MADEPARYLCFCCGGLEPEAVEAAREFLRSAAPEHADACTIGVFSLDGSEQDAWTTPTHRPRVVTGTAALGRLLITAPRALPVAVMLRVPYFICVLALVGEAHALPSDKERGLPYVEAAVRDAGGWDGALVTWAAAQDALAETPTSPSWTERVAAFLGAAPPASEAEIPPTLSVRFRASVLRDGEHGFKKPEVMPVVGSGTAARLGARAVVNLTEFDLETVVLILEQHVHVGLSLDTRRSSWRAAVPAEPAAPPLLHRGLMATLRPSTAALLCYAARPGAGDVVCDFMAGVGTIPLVAATVATLPAAPVFGMGGDLNPLACECAAKNYKSLVNDVRGGRASLLRWDARWLPLRDACLDVCVSDLPFGKKHKVKGGNIRHLYGHAFRECARTLRPGGRLVLLAAGSKAVADALQDRYNAGCWRPWAQSGDAQEAGGGSGSGEGGNGVDWAPRAVNVGGLLCYVFFVERTLQPLPAPPAPASQKEQQHEAAEAGQQKKQRTEL